MIALCRPHHDEADAGVYTLEQLRKLKVSAQTGGAVRGRFNWKREQTLLKAGSYFGCDCPTLFESGDEKLVWLEKDDNGYDMINLKLHGKQGALACQIENNDWIAWPSADDVEAPPSTTSLIVRSEQEGIRFSIRFSNKSRSDAMNCFQRAATREETYQSLLPAFERMLNNRFPPGQDILLCELGLQVEYPFSIHVTDTSIKTKLGNASFELRNVVVPGATLVKVG